MGGPPKSSANNSIPMTVISGALALTHTKWAHKLDFPQPDWPVADFPLRKYPLDQFTQENEREEERCLDMVCLHDCTQYNTIQFYC